MMYSRMLQHAVRLFHIFQRLRHIIDHVNNTSSQLHLCRRSFAYKSLLQIEMNMNVHLPRRKEGRRLAVQKVSNETVGATPKSDTWNRTTGKK